MEGEKKQRIYIGKRIAEERARLGISQTDLANLSGINRATIAKIELGKWSVGIDILGKIAEAMGLRLDLVSRPE